MSARRFLIALAVAVLTVPPAWATAQSPVLPDTLTGTTGAMGASTIAGVVYDSLSRMPLADATVQLIARAAPGIVYSTHTDSAGAFRLTHVQHGRYLAGFLHPVLDTLGLSDVETLVTVDGDSVTGIALATPSAPTLRAKLCKTTNVGDSTGMMLGIVHDADSNAPLPGSSVIVSWDELVIDHGLEHHRHVFPVVTNANGWYAVCGLPTDGPILARARLGARSSGPIEIAMSPRGVLHRDFGIGSDSAIGNGINRSTPHGTARLAGVVRSSQGRPLVGARVELWGTTYGGATSDSGAFVLSELPSGTQTIEVRSVGYAPKRVSVDLAGGRAATVTVTLERPAELLSAVNVYGKAAGMLSMNGFRDRQRLGIGHFLTRDDITRFDAVQLTDALRTVPNVQIVPMGTGTTLRLRGCAPAVYLDGMLMNDQNPDRYRAVQQALSAASGMTSSRSTGTNRNGPDNTNRSNTAIADATMDINTLILPEEILGIEVYNSSTEAPPQFRTPTGCGSIVIWSGGGASAREKGAKP
jgi:hypothetical protein